MNACPSNRRGMDKANSKSISGSQLTFYLRVCNVRISRYGMVREVGEFVGLNLEALLHGVRLLPEHVH